MITKTLRKVNDFCREINNREPTILMNIIEIDPISPEQTSVLCGWFRMVLAISKWDKEEFAHYHERLIGVKNIILMNEDPTDVADKFSKEFVNVVLINSDVPALFFEWQNKIFHGGYICGKNNVKIPEFITPDKRYNFGFWLAQKE